ncbi:hypothetical protein P6144_01620 [Sphingomonas sp. HITSZ_GF]|uniref:hypothetical protein n=1 Tax=Sphingomonas sp. HITSZ_GF TaxID=3037247 RepID=UPI00240E7074|nr:hypothetical protein [Sphingomonas sp. HITSZ_GF]MDG2532331.1 hypothetical protein [Sphingomonas sp. HITSZ_GF]
MIDHYDWAGGREAMLRFGPATGPVVVAALPLFEEANRTRAFVVTILRHLAERGIVGVLPDLPGQGESLVPTAEIRLANLRAAYAAAARAAGAPAFGLALRSGALLDGGAVLAGRWHFAPQSGPELLRELGRIRQAGGAEDFGGNLLSADFLTELDNAAVEPGYTVRVDRDPKDADFRVDAAPLWRRAEPDNDAALAALLADDIAAWMRTCGA